MNEIAPASKRHEGDSNPGLLQYGTPQIDQIRDNRNGYTLIRKCLG